MTENKQTIDELTTEAAQYIDQEWRTAEAWRTTDSDVKKGTFAVIRKLIDRVNAEHAEVGRLRDAARDNFQRTVPSESGRWVVLSNEQYAGGMTADEATDVLEENKELLAQRTAARKLIIDYLNDPEAEEIEVLEAIAAALATEENQ